MSFKQLNPGLYSAMRGCELIAFSFRVNGTSDPDGIVQGASNAVETIAYAAGQFTVTLNKTWPRQVVAIVAGLASASATSIIEDVRYVADSYDSAAGTFVIEGVTDDGDGTLTVEALTDNSVISVIMVVQNVDSNTEDASS